MSHLSDCNEKRVPDECKPCELTCLERPRYFCGQLLTEEDLAAEQRYQREQNKLHNRHLHGWGVVCGLEVVCHPKCSSKGNVLIKKGHAIDCCGNDIIVCKDDELNIIEKIKECQPKPKEDDCLPGANHTDDKCKDLEKKYCLIIKYKEKPSRPVTALKRDDDGCSVKKCEPSRIKEMYEFEVKECKECGVSDGMYNKDRIDKRIEKYSTGSFPDRIDECLSILKEEHPQNEHFDIAIDIITNREIVPEKHNEYLTAYCEIKEYLLESLETSSVKCDMKDKIPDFPDYPMVGRVGTTNIAQYKAGIIEVFIVLLVLLSQKIIDCICFKLLYPCPECKEEDKVVLACITVQGDKIKDICNLSRRQVMTFPKLFYWLPVNVEIWAHIMEICCEIDLLSYVQLRKSRQYVNMPANIAMAKNMYTSSFRTIMADFINPFKVEEGVSVGSVYKMEVSEAEKLLNKRGIAVGKKVDFKPSLEMLSKKNILSTPFAVQPGSKVDLFVKDNKVMYVIPHEEVEKVDEAIVKNLVKEFNTLKTDLNIMKSSMISMRRDPDSTIELKANIEKAYLPLTEELVKALTKEMKPEVLKDIDKVRGGELKKAGIMSVSDVFTATTAAVSAATKEPVPNAAKYIDHAENKTLEVAREVSSELKRVKATKKEDLLKKEIDTKGLAKKLKLSEKTVKKVISDISGIK